MTNQQITFHGRPEGVQRIDQIGLPNRAGGIPQRGIDDEQRHDSTITVATGCLDGCE